MKVPSPLLWKRMFLPPCSPGGPQATRMPLYWHLPDSGTRRRLGIEVDVVGDEQIEMAVPVVVEKRAAGVPALQPVASVRVVTPALRRDIDELPLPLLR